MKVYVITEIYRYVVNMFETNSTVKCVTIDYNEALKEYNELKQSWEAEFEDWEISESGKNIYSSCYTDEGDGVLLELLEYEI